MVFHDGCSDLAEGKESHCWLVFLGVLWCFNRTHPDLSQLGETLNGRHVGLGQRHGEIADFITSLVMVVLSMAITRSWLKMWHAWSKTWIILHILAKTLRFSILPKTLRQFSGGFGSGECGPCLTMFHHGHVPQNKRWETWGWSSKLHEGWYAELLNWNPPGNHQER